MKHIHIYFITALAFISIISQPVLAQNNSAKKTDKEVLIKNLLDSQRFTFVPQSMSPLRGGFRNITSYYDVKISKDTMRCYLPYFGQAFTASIGSTTGPMDFVSHNIEYALSPAKKHGWNIAIKPKDKPEIQQFLFTVYDNGTATLNVTSTSRDAISYSGFITKNNSKK